MKASVIISAYNSADFIGETIKSVLAQDYDDYEIIVVDDGSTDDTESVVRGFSDQPIPVRYIYQENSGGPSRPRNVGIQEARGEYLFIFDSDDLMLPGKLEAQVAALEANENAAAAFTQFQSVDEDGNIIRPQFLLEYETLWNLLPNGIDTEIHAIPSEDMFRGLIKANFVGTSSVALRASVVRNQFQFDESMSNSDDRLMWVTLANQHSWVFLGQPYHQYRERQSSITRRNITRRAASRIYGLKKIRNMCDRRDQIRLINMQISDIYISLAYYQREHDSVLTGLKSSLQAVRYHFSWRPVRVLFSVIWFDVKRAVRQKY